MLSFADEGGLQRRVGAAWCSAEWRKGSGHAWSLSNIEKHSLAANGEGQRPWAADRYLPSDLADGDFHSTASLSRTTASLACKEGRSLFYGSGKTTHASPSGPSGARQMTVDYCAVADLDRDRADGVGHPAGCEALSGETLLATSGLCLVI